MVGQKNRRKTIKDQSSGEDSTKGK